MYIIKCATQFKFYYLHIKFYIPLQRKKSGCSFMSFQYFFVLFSFYEIFVYNIDSCVQRKRERDGCVWVCALLYYYILPIAFIYFTGVGEKDFRFMFEEKKRKKMLVAFRCSILVFILPFTFLSIHAELFSDLFPFHILTNGTIERKWGQRQKKRERESKRNQYLC